MFFRSKPSGLTCPVCGSSNVQSIAARVAPFIQARANVDEEANAASNLCGSCEHVFLTPFLSSDQLSAVYTGYRDAAYDAQRLIFEPGYAATIASYDEKDSPFTQHRNNYYDRFFAEYACHEVNVIDFGGEDGGFCRRAFPAATVTVVEHDYSGDLPALLRSADVLFCAHVFEHIPKPFDLLKSLTRYMRRGSMLYIELPINYEGSLTSCYNGIKGLLERGEPMPWHPLVTLHEHVNHYSKKSAQTLAARVGYVPKEYYMTNLDIFGMTAFKL